LPGAPWWSLIFFFTLVTLGIDSAFSITESVLAALVDKTGWRRSIVLPLMSLVGLAFGLFYVTRGGLNWLGTIDGFVNGTWGIAFLGLLECIVLGWFYRVDNLRAHANERSDWNLGRWWNYAIRIFIPVVLGTLCLWSLFDDLTQQGGFLMSPLGEWNSFNCVGMAVVGFVPIIAVIMSLIKSARRHSAYPAGHEIHNPNLCGGRLGGIFALCLAAASGAMIVVFLLVPNLSANVANYLLYQALGLGAAGIILSSYLLDKYHSAYAFPSWFARWAGIIATIDISGFLAVMLIRITAEARDAEIQASKAEHLSAVSYVILSVVFLLIIGGLGWCFYRAMGAAGSNAPVQPQSGAGPAE
jgi:NSS family neurotransmitter:Na+ symporter